MIFRRSLIYSGSALAARGINLCTISFILAKVGQTSYGAYQFHLSLLNIAMSFGLLGTSALLFREFSHGLRHACNWLFHGLSVRFAGVGVTILAVAAFFPLAGFHIDPWLFSGCALLVIGESTIQLNSAWLRARRFAVSEFVFTVGRSLLVFACVALILHRMPNGRGIAMGYLIGVGIVIATILWEWRRPLRIGRAQPFSFRQMILPAGTILLLEAMGTFYSELPVIFLGHSGDFREVGLFATCFKFLTAAAFFSASYDQSFQPEFTRAARRGDPGLHALLIRGMASTAGIGVVSGIGVLAFGPLVLRWFAHLPSAAPYLIYAYAAFPLATGVAALMDNCLIGIGRERLLILSHGSGLGVMIACLFALPLSGAILASVSIVMAYVVKSLVAASLLVKSLRHGIPKN